MNGNDNIQYSEVRISGHGSLTSRTNNIQSDMYGVKNSLVVQKGDSRLASRKNSIKQ